MGVDYSSAKKLIHHAARHGVSGSVLMLGRHRMQVKDKLVPALEKELEKAGFDLDFDDITQSDGYAETFFEALGAKEVQALDLSDFEGATLLHDLNDVVPEDWAGKFDLIFDGGTTEHIFDVARCMDNLNVLLAPNGVLASCVPANNWFAHGFYQFGPELVYGYWKHGCGFDVLDCVMLPEMPRDKEMPIGDPAEKGHRPRVRGKVPNQRVYLYYEVRKGPSAHRWNRALQTDYVRKWSDHDKEQDREASEIVAMREQQLAKASAQETA
ncbi:MAG: class I SAM-dependent methyltransferase [Boseongicola sp.]|nr:class I SAM-dependent methyltransferase [Boseongicola sp.]